MWLAEIWRYPVKSMAGEPLDEVELGLDGIPGDRRVAVEGHDGRVVTARRKPGLLRLRATTGPAGEPLVDGRPWGSPEVAREVERAAGAGTRLVELEGLERFDVLPLLVATDGAIAFLGRDRRRFRPNLLVGGAEGLVERGWEGARLRVGDAIVRLAQLRERCVMTTFDPDTGEQDPEVLRTIVRQLGGRLGLDTEVIEPGRIRVGSSVELLG